MIMHPHEIERTKSASVVCMGKDSIYDHPKVYLEINTKIGKIRCPYCNKEFQLHV